MTKPMQPAVRQPIGFWTARVAEAVRTRTRGRLAEIGITQPQWWLLHQLSLHPDGVDDAAVIATIGPNESDDAIREAITASAQQGWITRDGSQLRSTAAGAELFRHAAAIQQELEAERRVGISDAEFATTIEVLQRTAHNVGSDAWHW